MSAKKLFTAFLAVMILAGLTGCGRTANTDETKSTTNAAATQSDTDNGFQSVTSTPGATTAEEAENANSTSSVATETADSATTSTEPTDTPAEPDKSPVTESTQPPQTQPPAHRHSYSASVTAPTCTSGGFTTHTCSCGDRYTDSQTAALGHSAGAWIINKDAAVGAAGQRERRCTRCNTVMQTEAVPALRDPNSVTPEEEARIIREVRAYAESYAAKGFTFEWKESMEFSWEVGWYGTPRVRYEGVDGVISRLKTHVDKIYKAGTNPSLGMTTTSVTFKVVKTIVDGDVAFAVIYGG